jgi:hypothetical protein
MKPQIPVTGRREWHTIQRPAAIGHNRQIVTPVKVARCAVEAALASDEPPEYRRDNPPGRSSRRNGKCWPPAYNAPSQA